MTNDLFSTGLWTGTSLEHKHAHWFWMNYLLCVKNYEHSNIAHF